ncbi:hypothetical protein PR048_005278 [Dryococelus australis]|uniref:Transposase n=1 Tax=Dryococelus australis TaxID=614101 RepID=A0ABQ9I7R2_9NEOP|nr:hypothetical protein PR048_005278 [Dryococelus australis]
MAAPPPAHEKDESTRPADEECENKDAPVNMICSESPQKSSTFVCPDNDDGDYDGNVDLRTVGGDDVGDVDLRTVSSRPETVSDSLMEDIESLNMVAETGTLEENTVDRRQHRRLGTSLLEERILERIRRDPSVSTRHVAATLRAKFGKDGIANFHNNHQREYDKRQATFSDQHFGRPVQVLLDESFHGRWIGQSGLVVWPPCSHDINPMTFYLWGHVKSLVYAAPIANAEVLHRNARRRAIMEEIRSSAKTDVDWSIFCRGVCIKWLYSHRQCIGGPSTIVDIDESKLGKRKNCKGHKAEGQWVFGAVQRHDPSEFFLVPVSRINASTLTKVIRKFSITGVVTSHTTPMVTTTTSGLPDERGTKIASRHASRQRGIVQQWPVIEAMTTSLSVLIAKVITKKTLKTRACLLSQGLERSIFTPRCCECMERRLRAGGILQLMQGTSLTNSCRELHDAASLYSNAEVALEWAAAQSHTSHSPGSIPGGFAPGFSYVGIVLDDAACCGIFRGTPVSHHPCIPAPLHPRDHVMSYPGMKGTNGSQLESPSLGGWSDLLKIWWNMVVREDLRLAFTHVYLNSPKAKVNFNLSELYLGALNGKISSAGPGVDDCVICINS